MGAFHQLGKYGKSKIMSGGRKVVELWSDPVAESIAEAPAPVIARGNPHEHELVPPIDNDFTDDLVAPAKPPRRINMFGVLLFVLAIGWLGFASFAIAPKLLSGNGEIADITSFITSISSPLALLAFVWLLARREKLNDQDSLNQTIERLREEQASLRALISTAETRMFDGASALHAQAEQLDVIGESTLNRIATLRAMLGEEIGQIGLHTNGLKNAAAAARSDMAVLLANLPKAHIETRKMVVALQDAGLTAQEQAQALVGHLGGLAEKGQVAQEIAGAASETLAGHMSQMESQAFAMRSLVQQSQISLEKISTTSADTLQERVQLIDKQIATLGVQLGAHDGLSEKLFGNLRAGLADVEGRLAAIDTHGTERTERLTDAIKGLTDHSHVLREALGSSGDSADSLIAKSENLMVALDAATREIEETLPNAFSRLDQTAASTHSQITTTVGHVEGIEARLAATNAMLNENMTALSSHQAHVNETHEKLTESHATAQSLTELLAACETDMAGLSEGASLQLIETLLRVRETAQQASERAKEALHSAIPDAAAALGDASKKAMVDALSVQVEGQMAHITAVAQQAIEATEKATARLMRQMLTISETSAAFSAQMSEAEQSHEASAQTALSRRVSLLSESLNSNSSDVTKILSNDVTDAAWASYLKGDRGIFTRRAVKLIDGSESREIVRYYDTEPEFREHVNHYIHDFEAMLRAVLSSRESGALSVTLLSSDMGKLYVALAQAIERLRT